jgi:hypothetical protein
MNTCPRWLCSFMLAGAVLAAGCARKEPALRAPPMRAVEVDLSILATGGIHRSVTTKSTEAFIDSLLEQPDFANKVAPLLLFGEMTKRSPNTPGPGFTLETNREGVLFLREPCSLQEAVQVHPWWDLAATVRVCPDSYQPTRLKDPRGNYCGSVISSPDESSFCGCGPNLAFCYVDGDHRRQVVASMQDELVKTVASFVTRDLPLRTLFTSRETVRDANAELLYLRSRIINGEPVEAVELSTWPKDGKLAARHEAIGGQHAGVLTTPQLLYFRDNPRDRLQMFYERLWCSGPPHHGKVTADVVLGLGTGNVRVGNSNDRVHSWKELAARPVCTGCHARMDYGAQFFAGYREVRVAPFFVTNEVVPGKGPLYHHDIEDPRGEGRLTPLGFAELALAQPEFGRCMVQEVAQHVFADRATPADLLALRESFETEGTLRAMMRVALRRYAARLALPPPVTSRTAALGELLEQHCGECHADGARAFLSAAWDRPLLLKMLTQVSFGTMPKNDSLSPEERARLVDALAVAAFPDSAVRALASGYFQDRLRSLPAHSLPALLRIARGDDAGREGRLGPSRHLIAVPPDLMQLSPGVAAILATEAAASCSDSKEEGLERCLAKRLSWRTLVYARGAED